MHLVHTRRQHPVGQGFFHSGDLCDEDGNCLLRYVVDCGSKATYKSARENQIDDFVRSVGSVRTLDLLFVSHVHDDHVSGIERLLDGMTGLRVDTIMMPLTTVEERLIAFARSVEEDASVVGSAFYRQFIVDPEEALSRFGPRQIIFVRPGAPDDGAPGRTGDPDAPLPEGERPHFTKDRKPPFDWRFVGKGQIDDPTAFSTGSKPRSAARVRVIPDSAAIAVSGGQGHWEWLIAPYVDPKVRAGIAKFEKRLAFELNIYVAEYRKLKGNASYVQNLIVNHVNALTSAYRKVASDLNVTSLCLYSGPAASPDTGDVYCFEGHYGEQEFSQLCCFGRGGWLGTGDAALKEKVRLDAFLWHYGHLLDQVTTLTMPHHGSDRNFHPDLLSRVQPIRCVAAAAKFSDWCHPGTNVVQSVASRGSLLLVATSDERSIVIERLHIHLE